MDERIADFTEAQRVALLDLLVLAQYLDRHLASGEDARLNRWLQAMGYDNPYDRQRQFDAAVTRVRKYAENPELSRSLAVKLSKSFTTQEQCKRVQALLEELITCDGGITEDEKRFLDTLKDAFQV